MNTRPTLHAVLAATSITLLSLTAPPARAGNTDLTGNWKLDAAHSDVPPVPGDMAGARKGGKRAEGGGGMGGGMGEGMRGGMPGGPRGGRGGRGTAPGGGEGDAREGDRARRTAILPALMHITQTSTLVSLEDSTGAVVEEITTLGAVADTLAHAPGAVVSQGAWQDTALVVERGGQGRISMTRTFTLEQTGSQLVIHTRIATPDGETVRDIRRVYRRVSEG